MRDSRIVFPSTIPSPQHAGYPLHLISATGTTVGSFGSERPEVDSRCGSECNYRELAPSRNQNAVWVTRRTVYEIEEWSVTGPLLRTLTIKGSPWFPEELGARQQLGERAPGGTFANITGIWEDTQGLVWVVALTGEAKPSGAPQPAGRTVRVRPQTVETPGTTVIEVIDLATRQVIASTRLPRQLYLSLGENRLYERKEDSDGVVSIEVVRVRLRR
jgi:hypothetical protein